MQLGRAQEISRRIDDLKSKYEIFGRLLKVPRDLVKRIRKEHDEPETRLLHIIEAFLRQKDPRPTWRIILEALRNPLINAPRLAGKIERIYGFQPSDPLGMYPKIVNGLNRAFVH